MKPQFCVQAWTFGLGWVDCDYCETEEEAKASMTKLLAKDSAWMSGTKERKVRVVPIGEARAYRGDSNAV